MSISLADKIFQSPRDTFPYYQSPVEFSSYNLQDLITDRFRNFRSAEFEPNLTLHLGGPDDTEEDINNYIEGAFSGVVVPYDESESALDFPRKVAHINLFVSHDGAYLLEEHHKLKSIKDDELAIFLEVPDDDTFSGNVLLIKAGKNAKKYADLVLHSEFLSERYSLTQEQTEDLLSSLASGEGFFNQLVSTTTSFVGDVVEGGLDLGIFVFDKIATFFGKTLRINESIWNASDPNYGFGKFEDGIVPFLNGQIASIKAFVEKYKGFLPVWAVVIFRLVMDIAERIVSAMESFLKEHKDNIEANFAFACGLWNGFMDLIGGIFMLVKMIFQGLKASRRFFQNIAYYKQLTVEYLDNLLQAIMAIDWEKVMLQALRSLSKLGPALEQLPDFLEKTGKKIEEGIAKINHTEVGYYTGYVLFQIIEFLFPPLKLAKLAKAGKLEKVVDKFTDLMETVFAGTRRSIGAAGKRASGIVELFFDMIRGVIGKLKGGTAAFSKWIDDIFVVIKKWLDDVLGVGKKLADDFVKKLPANIATFVNKLGPNVQRRVLNGLLVLEFNGKLLCKISPIGIIKELKLYRAYETSDVVTTLKNAKILVETEVNGRKVTKIYRDFIEVIKRYDGEVIFRAKFIEGAKRDASLVNEIFVRSKNVPPYQIGSKVIDRVLKAGERFFIVESKIEQRFFGSFASTYKVKSVEELRTLLGVKKAWKKPPMVIKEFEVTANVRVREDGIGALYDELAERWIGGKGTQQYEFLEDMIGGTDVVYEAQKWNDFLELISKKDLPL